MEETKEKKWPPKRIFGMRVMAFIETMVFLSLMLTLEHYFGDGDRFFYVNPHPFWIIIILIASLYGTTDALAATALATLFLYVDNVPKQTFNESLFDYQLRLSILPFTWFAASFVLGEIRYRQDEIERKLKIELRDSSEKNRVITRHYNVLKKIKENLEARLAAQENTTANVYRTFRVLETLNPARLLLALDGVVANILKPKKFSVYAKGENGFEAAICHGWDDDDQYDRRFYTNTPVYDVVGNQQRLVCVVNRDDEKLLDGQGVIAGPLVDKENGEVFGMIKIEEMDFESLHLSNLEAFKALTECIGMAYAQARQYQKAQKEAIYSHEVSLYSQPLYTIMQKKWSSLATAFGIPVSLICVTAKSMQRKQIDPAEARAFKKVLEEATPDFALLFHGKRSGLSAEILLPMLEVKEAEKISHHVFEELTDIDLLNEWRFTIKVEEIEAEKERERKPV